MKTLVEEVLETAANLSETLLDRGMPMDEVNQAVEEFAAGLVDPEDDAEDRLPEAADAVRRWASERWERAA